MPPSTAIEVPDTADAAGEARYAIAAATSSADTRRPLGWRALSAARSASGLSAESSRRPTQGVSAVPGDTPLTQYLYSRWAYSIDRQSESATLTCVHDQPSTA